MWQEVSVASSIIDILDIYLYLVDIQMIVRTSGTIKGVDGSHSDIPGACHLYNPSTKRGQEGRE